MSIRPSRVFIRALLRFYEQRAATLFSPRSRGESLAKRGEEGPSSARTGTVTFIQRFGSALNLNVHFHTVALDGVFVEGADGKLRFAKLPAPSDELPDGRHSLRLKSPWTDGTTHFLFQPDQLIERLCSLIPRPQVNLVLYHGVLAPNSKLRRRITKHGRNSLPPERRTPNPATRAAARKWAALMQRAFALDVLACPRCAGRERASE